MPGNCPDILDFANYVFSQSSQPHDFRRLLPKLYGENSGSEGYHYLVREDGRIRAMVCAMPLSLLVAGKPLRRLASAPCRCIPTPGARAT